MRLSTSQYMYWDSITILFTQRQFGVGNGRSNGSLWLGYTVHLWYRSLITRFMGPTWGPPGADRTQVGPVLAPWIMLSGGYRWHWFRKEMKFNLHWLMYRHFGNENRRCWFSCGVYHSSNKINYISFITTWYHIAWQWQVQNINKTRNSQKTPYLAANPHGRAMGSFCELFENYCHVIKFDCISFGCFELSKHIWSQENHLITILHHTNISFLPNMLNLFWQFENCWN